jgi:hypothetical protein
LPVRLDVEVIDVTEQPALAERDKILATPTLVRRLPEPIRKIIGISAIAIGCCSASIFSPSPSAGVCGREQDADRHCRFRRHRPWRAPAGTQHGCCRHSRQREAGLRAPVSRRWCPRPFRISVCLTFEERPEALMRNVSSFGWALDRLVADRRMAFVDCSPDLNDPRDEIGGYDLSALMARIENAVSSIKATRLAADAIRTLLSRFRDLGIVRSELSRFHEGLGRMGLTSLITMERTDEDGGVSRLGIEEFVAEQDRRRRTIEILKFRGTNHRKGEEYTINGTGMHVGDPFRNVHGISTGMPSYVVGEEKARRDDMFDA